MNSYSTEFFHEFKYLSDSRRHWREDVTEIIRRGEHSRLHILTHPFWYMKEEKDIKQTLAEFIQRAGKERYDILQENIRDFESILLYEDVKNL